jgi:hypothetical protein
MLITFLFEKYAALCVFKRMQQQRELKVKGQSLATVPETFIAIAQGVNITSAVLLPILVSELFHVDPCEFISSSHVPRSNY